MVAENTDADRIGSAAFASGQSVFARFLASQKFDRRTPYRLPFVLAPAEDPSMMAISYSVVRQQLVLSLVRIAMHWCGH
ncbi:hypothetical protein QFZ96_002488 [Paraburkholderia youngii]